MSKEQSNTSEIPQNKPNAALVENLTNKNSSNNDAGQSSGNEDNNNPSVKKNNMPSSAQTDHFSIENTRSKAAIIVIFGFFTIVYFCFVYAAYKQAPLKELKDLLGAVSGYLSGILGFVLGYYFKNDK